MRKSKETASNVNNSSVKANGGAVKTLSTMRENQTMTSLQIVQITNVSHDNLIKSIRKMEVSWLKVTGVNFNASTYKDKSGRKNPMYILNFKECMYVGTKFNDEARAKLILRWDFLEQEQLKKIAPIGCVYPIVQNGVIGYPRKELLQASNYSYKCGSRYNKRYPSATFVINRIACFTPELAKLIYERGKVRQLELNFNFSK